MYGKLVGRRLRREVQATARVAITSDGAAANSLDIRSCNCFWGNEKFTGCAKLAVGRLYWIEDYRSNCSGILKLGNETLW